MILRLSRLLSDMFAPGGDFGRTLPIFWCAPPKPNVPTLAATPAALALARAVGFFRGTLVVFREIPAFPFPAFFFPAFFFAVSIMKNKGCIPSDFEKKVSCLGEHCLILGGYTQNDSMDGV
jgi:hypothetical protein